MAILAALGWLKGQVVEVLFPSRCTGCGKEGSFFCASCCNKLPYLKGPVCPKCGKPGVSAGPCAECYKSPPIVDRMRAAFIFEGTIRSAIHDLKYRDIRALARPLAEFMFAYIRENSIKAEVIVPVPLHKSRLKQRGYNQAELLAGELDKLTGWPMENRVLVRLKDAPPQARTGSAKERSRNVEGAFACQGSVLKDKAVLLVDDVCTTGATLNACALALKKLPVTSVDSLTLAREL